SDLEISTTGRFLVAGTHGRGAWTVPLVDPNPAEFTVTLTPDAPSSFGRDFGNELTVGAISGSVMVQTGAPGAATTPQPNVTVYLDLNRNGTPGPGEPT